MACPSLFAAALWRFQRLLPTSNARVRQQKEKQGPFVYPPKKQVPDRQTRRKTDGRERSAAPGRRLPRTGGTDSHDPRISAKFDPRGQILAAGVFFSFGPRTARFLFFFAKKKRKWGVHLHQPSHG